jgi:Ni,Fe-hydrogenase I small subunit
MGALAAAVGMSQAEVSKLAEAFAGNTAALGGTFNKPRVIWIHGAECTGCSTSLLSILESENGHPIYRNSTVTTGAALGLAGVTAYDGSAFPTLGGGLRTALYGTSTYGGAEPVNIADVVIDVVDLQYHETVMGMGGDLAAKWLADFRATGGAAGEPPFVLVVEGALQKKSGTGAWNNASTTVPWCSIGVKDDGTGEQDMPEVVGELAVMSNCAAIIPIGQCACYGGYPGCKPRISDTVAKKGVGGFDPTMSQTGAKGVYDYLSTGSTAEQAAAGKVINVPGCPTNPWWFVLTVVLIMSDLVSATNFVLPPTTGASGTLDYGRRSKLVYPIPVHSAWCPRYPKYTKGIYAAKPGDPGCLQKLGCKGISTLSSCGIHGWNNQQPENGSRGFASINGGGGGHCTTAGAPCMACTEKGYPDSFVPFVKL